MSDDIAKAIAARPRNVHMFDMVAVDRRLEGIKVAVRALTTGEREAALAAGQARIRTMLMAEGLTKPQVDELLATHPTLAGDSELVEMLWRSMRDATDPSRPAVPTADWLRDHMTSDELGVCLNWHNAVRQRETPIALGLEDDAAVEALAERCAALAPGDEADEALARCSREFLASFAVALAVKLRDARRAEADAIARLESGGPTG